MKNIFRRILGIISSALRLAVLAVLSFWLGLMLAMYSESLTRHGIQVVGCVGILGVALLLWQAQRKGKLHFGIAMAVAAALAGGWFAVFAHKGAFSVLQLACNAGAATFVLSLLWAWIVGRRNLFFGAPSNRVYGWALVGLASMTVLYYSMEKWRGKQMWARVEQDLAARGMGKFPGWKSPVLPEDQDMAKASIFAPLNQFVITNGGQRTVWIDEAGYNRLKAIRVPPRFNFITGISSPWTQQTNYDYAETAVYLRSNSVAEKRVALPGGPDEAVVMAYINGFSNELEQVRAASLRQGASFKPHGAIQAIVYHLSRTFAWRAAAELKMQQTDAALEDIRCALRLARAEYPNSLNNLVPVVGAMFSEAMQPVWEGIQERRWSDAQLALIQQDLASFDALSFHETFAGNLEWLWMDQINEIMPISPLPQDIKLVGVDENATGIKLARVILPIGWSYEDQAAIYFQGRELFSVVDPAKHRVFPEEVRKPTANYPMDPIAGRIERLRVRTAFEILAKGEGDVQTRLNLGTIACALERYRVAEGRYPEKLDALFPRYMAKVPDDIYTGQPLKYEITSNGKFVLHSVGWNQTDDHCKPDSDDLVWTYSPIK